MRATELLPQLTERVCLLLSADQAVILTDPALIRETDLHLIYTDVVQLPQPTMRVKERALLAYPLYNMDNLAGVLVAIRQAPNPFEAHETLILQTLAEQIELQWRVQATQQELNTHQEISRLAISSEKWDEVLPNMAERIARLFDADACAITLWDTQERRPRRLAVWGVDTEAFFKERNRPAGVPNLTSQIVKDLKPVFIDRVDPNEPAPTPFIQEYGAKALVALPLIARGRAIGAVFLMRLHHAEPFRPEQVDVATPSLNHMALAVDNQLLLADTQRRLGETNNLLEVASIAASSLHLDDMLQQVLRMAKQMINVKAGAVLLFDQTEQVLRYHSGSGAFGFGEDYRHQQFPVKAGHNNNLLAQVFTSGQPQFVNEISEYKGDFQEIIEQTGMRNFLIAPLKVQDFPMGVVAVADKPGDFTHGDAGLLVAMGSHIAAALRNTQLLQDTRERLRETEALQHIAAITSATLDLDEMLTMALSETANVLNAEGAMLLLVDSTNTQLVTHVPSLFGVTTHWTALTWALDGPGHPVGVFRSGRPYISNDPPSQPDVPRRNILTVPLKTRQRVVGVLSIVNRRDGNFLPSHGDLAIAIGSQIAISVEGLQLLTAERQRADLMQTINQISQELTATLDLRSLTRKVATSINTVLGYDAVYVYLLDDTGKNLVLHGIATTNTDHYFEPGFTAAANTGIMGRAIQTRQSQLIQDIQLDPDYFKHPKLADMHSAVAVTLRHSNVILGVLGVLSTQTNAFTDVDVSALETLASQVSIAIDNARLYNQAQRRLLEQGIVHQIGQDITSILDYNDLVLAVARHMTRALDTAICVVSVYNPVHDTIRVEAEYRLPGFEEKTGVIKVGGAYPLSKRLIAQQAIRSRRPVMVYVEDENAPAEFRDLLRLEGNFSILSVPMTVGERVIGLVSWMESRRPRRFTLDDERLAQTLVSQAAIAIENARLFREADRRAREQALLRQIALLLSGMNSIQDLVARFVKETREALQADNAVVSLADGEGHLLIVAESLTSRTLDQMALSLLKRTEGAIWDMLQEGESVMLAPEFEQLTPAQAEVAYQGDDENRPIMVLAPISHRGKVLGVMEISADRPASAFDAAQLQLLESLANQAAIAIENVRLSEREQRRLRQLERIQESGRLMASELNMQHLLHLVVKEAAGIFEVEAAAVAMPDEHGLRYEIKTGHNLSPRFMGGRRIAMEEISPESHEPVLVRDPKSRVSSKQAALFEEENITSALFVPLFKGHNLLGQLELYSRAGQTFSEQDLDVAQVLASQIGVAIDNADLFNKLEERAEELAAANKLKSQFLANISHELRTPMNSILGFSETLMSGLYGDLNEKQSSRMERIFRNGKNLLSLIDDLLDISKIDAGRMQMVIEPVNLRDEMQAALSAIESQAQNKGIYLKLNLPEGGEMPLVLADQLRLRQVINNLVSNAVKFTKEGGVTLTAELKNEVRLSPKPGERERQEVVWVSVADTGIGISLEDQLIIFDEFRQADGSATREFGGTGLGLAICKRLIELMGGRIWVDSEAGQGSVFTFVLPTARN